MTAASRRPWFDGSHRPALDGWRGVAVAAVVAFHLAPRWVPGGWLGVSLFFTLSGFLIVGLVDRQLEAGTLDLREFYRRRARRLLPALCLTLLVVMVAVWAARPELLDRVRADVVAAGLYVANWRQAAQPGGYDAIFDTTPRPLAHLWSLAVEEQLYLVVPGLMVLTRRPVATVAALVAVGVGGLWFWWGDPDLYFATPVRALEVLAGGALALGLNRCPPARIARLVDRRWSVALQVAGAAAVVGLAVSVPESDAFTRPWLLPAVAVGVWCPLLIAGLHHGGPLAWGPLRWLGERSYAIYLFHWPLIELTSWSAPVVVGVTLALADASYRLVEMPVRRGRLVRRAPLARLAGASLVVALIAASPIPGGIKDPVSAREALTIVRRESPGSVASPSTSPPSITPVPDPTNPTTTATTTPVPDPTNPTTTTVITTSVVEAPAAPPRTVLLVGDSTAMRIADAFEVWAGENGIELRSRARMACSPVARTWEVWIGIPDQPIVEPNDCPPQADALDVDAVVIVHHGVLNFRHRRPGGAWVGLVDSEQLRDDVIQAYAELADSTDARVLIASVPVPASDAESVDPAAAPVASDLIAALAAARSDVEMVDSSVVETDPGRYPRGDGVHLDPVGAAAYVLDVIAPSLLGQPDTSPR